jgi:hypothetical protein
MRVERRDPPREFRVGTGDDVVIRHAADVQLDDDEQVTFTGPSGSELDLVRKKWGYYATPSMNARLREHGLRAALVVNERRRLYLLLVEEGAEREFEAYLKAERQRLICWLDSDEAVEWAVSRLES